LDRHLNPALTSMIAPAISTAEKALMKIIAAFIA
jgi:hypothetical protein